MQRQIFLTSKSCKSFDYILFLDLFCFKGMHWYLWGGHGSGGRVVASPRALQKVLGRVHRQDTDPRTQMCVKKENSKVQSPFMHLQNLTSNLKVQVFFPILYFNSIPRSANNLLPTFFRSTFSQFSIRFRGPHFWNTSPIHIRNCTNIKSFKKHNFFIGPVDQKK